MKKFVSLILVLIPSLFLVGCNEGSLVSPSTISISVARDEMSSFKYLQAQNEVLKEVSVIAVSLYQTVEEDEVREIVKAICLKYGITDSILVKKDSREISISIGEIKTNANLESVEILLN